MFGPPGKMLPNMQWDTQRPPHMPHWRHFGGPRAPFRGQNQRFHQHRQPFQPGNDNYWCETCDRGFATQDILNKHKQQHEKCNIDGCQFVAHPKVITKHIQMQHSSGIYKKIANLHKPEEIEKWREERRKKYPTKINIDKKAAELKEKIDRGEKIGLDRNKNRFDKNNVGYNKDKQVYRNNSTGLKRRNNTRHNNEPRPKLKRNNFNKNQTTTKTLPTLEENRQLKPFTGILHLEMNSDNEVEEINETSESIDLIDDEDFETHTLIETKSLEIDEPTVCGALSSLMCDYGSTDEEENNEIVGNLSKGIKPECIANVQNGNKSNCMHNNKLNEQTDCQKDSRIETELQSVVQKPNVHNSENITHNTKPKPSLNIEIKNKTVNVLIQKHTDKDGKEISRDSTEQDESPIVRESNMENIVTPQNFNQDTVFTDSKSDYLQNICETELNKENYSAKGQNLDDHDSGPEEVKVSKSEDTMASLLPDSSKLNDSVVRKKTIIEKKQFRRPKPKIPSTLLYKLLYKEMQQERNIVLQCIRYIRRNNYFDKKQ